MAVRPRPTLPYHPGANRPAIGHFGSHGTVVDPVAAQLFRDVSGQHHGVGIAVPNIGKEGMMEVAYDDQGSRHLMLTAGDRIHLGV
jgi:hypothetical protein